MGIFTIGHSNRSIAEFVKILKEFSIDVVFDVRTVPKSRTNPQFNEGLLEGSLEAAGIGYVHMSDLGGFRKPLKDSRNTYWKNDSFRGFADYMQTDDFTEALEKVEETSKSKKVVIMCAEALSWRCHRFLISDALVMDGFEVIHILGEGETRKHMPTSSAKKDGNKIVYE